MKLLPVKSISLDTLHPSFLCEDLMVRSKMDAPNGNRILFSLIDQSFVSNPLHSVPYKIILLYFFYWHQTPICHHESPLSHTVFRELAPVCLLPGPSTGTSHVTHTLKGQLMRPKRFGISFGFR